MSRATRTPRATDRTLLPDELHNGVAALAECECALDAELAGAAFVQILADPLHPDHEGRLEWLGLDDAAQFEPAAFDPDDLSEALAKLR